MKHSIVLVFLWILRLVLPPRGDHRAAAGPSVRQEPEVICGWRRPIPAHLIVRTMPIGQDRLIPQYLIKWEQTPEDEKAAVLTRQAQEQAGQWEKTRQRKRRAAAFAASAGLPDPLHYLDDVTDAHGALIGRAV